MAEILSPQFGLIHQELEALKLVECGLNTDEKVEKGLINNLEFMKGLFELDLSHNTGIELQKLLKSLNKHLDHLETLSLSHCELSKHNLEPVSDSIEELESPSMGLSSLERLDLSNSFDNPQDVAILATIPCLSSVKFLNLEACELDKESL